MFFRILSLIFAFNLLFAETIKLPDSIRESNKVIKIHVIAEGCEYIEQAKKAFTYHGAFELVNSASSNYKIYFNNSNNSLLVLDIYKGSNLFFSKSFSGNDSYSLFLKALDTSIECLTDLKGIFSGELCFILKNNSNSELCTSDIFFKRARKLTNNRAHITRAKWSNDGNTLLFTSYHISGFPDLIELDINSKKIRTIANFEGTNIGGDYSPNGKKIAMILSGKKEKSPDLYIYDMLNGKFERALKTKAIESDPSWSPKGNKIVIVSDELGKPLLYVFDLKTKRKTLINSKISNYCTEPSWNPINEDIIAFTCMSNRRLQIALYSFRNKKSRLITNFKYGASEATWLPDGRHLIVTQRVQDKTRLVIIDTISGEAKPISSIDSGNISGGDYFLKD